MRRHQLVVGATALWVVVGCSGDPVGRGAGPAVTGRQAALSLDGPNGRTSWSLSRDESKELRRHLLTSVDERSRLARGKKNGTILRSFSSGGDAFHYALVYGDRGGPPTYSVLVRNGKPLGLIRYEWTKRGRTWNSEAAQLAFWNEDGKAVLQGGVVDERTALKEVAAVMEQVTAAVVSQVIRPAHAQLYFQECFAEYMDLAATAAALAVLIGAPDPTALTKLLAITLTAAYAKAVFKLNSCIDQQSEQAQPHTGEGGGDADDAKATPGTASSGSGDSDSIMELLRKLIADCEKQGQEYCAYYFT